MAEYRRGSRWKRPFDFPILREDGHQGVELTVVLAEIGYLSQDLDQRTGL
jgi:hypothetical protein